MKFISLFTWLDNYIFLRQTNCNTFSMICFLNPEKLLHFWIFLEKFFDYSTKALSWTYWLFELFMFFYISETMKCFEEALLMPIAIGYWLKKDRLIGFYTQLTAQMCTLDRGKVNAVALHCFGRLCVATLLLIDNSNKLNYDTEDGGFENFGGFEICVIECENLSHNKVDIFWQKIFVIRKIVASFLREVASFFLLFFSCFHKQIIHSNFWSFWSFPRYLIRSIYFSLWSQYNILWSKVFMLLHITKRWYQNCVL